MCVYYYIGLAPDNLSTDILKTNYFTLNRYSLNFILRLKLIRKIFIFIKFILQKNIIKKINSTDKKIQYYVIDH